MVEITPAPKLYKLNIEALGHILLNHFGGVVDDVLAGPLWADTFVLVHGRNKITAINHASSADRQEIVGWLARRLRAHDCHTWEDARSLCERLFAAVTVH